MILKEMRCINVNHNHNIIRKSSLFFRVCTDFRTFRHKNCFLMGEEVGELFAAVRRLEGAAPETRDACVAQVGEEIVDVMNYLLAIANRLEIDLEAAFRKKNRVNQTRTWS